MDELTEAFRESMKQLIDLFQGILQKKATNITERTSFTRIAGELSECFNAVREFKKLPDPTNITNIQQQDQGQLVGAISVLSRKINDLIKKLWKVI